MEYLGSWITSEGVIPTSKKLEAIVDMAPPRNRKEVRRFIRMIITIGTCGPECQTQSKH